VTDPGVPPGRRPVGTCAVADREAMLALGRRLAAGLRAGDLVLLDGPLGAGKTTLTQGLAAGLGVPGPVTSPTFVLAREHPAGVGGPGLVHVDAYRLSGFDELDDLDLGPAMARCVTVVEWGAGLAEPLGEDRLEITIERCADDSRQVRWRGVGPRWAGRRLEPAPQPRSGA
jgi:tRNA threonylcarbamoyladenosine biosynthesis protein TsaE